MKKLLSITPHLSTGGAPQVLVKRVELLKDELDIYVVEWNNQSNDFVIQKNRLKKLLKPDHFFTLGEDKSEVLRIIEKVQPDFLHFEEMPEFFVDFDLATKIYLPDRKYKIFETTHSSDYNVDDKTFFPDKFLFVSQYNSFKFSKFRIPSEVIEYPVEKRKIDSQRKLELMQKLGLDPKYKHVLNVGLFTRRKNQGYAFEIARQMENLPVKFHFIGNQADNFKYYWEPLLKNIPKNVKLWGERDNTFDFYDACDLFLFTSRGFRFDKELNPLVIKEALEHQIPQFLFPLDVYNRKYDIESDTINYLFGDIDVDSNLVKNFLFPSNYFDLRKIGTQENSIHRPKIRAVHLLLEEDDRRGESIQQMEKLKDYGIDYVQHINKRFTETPPKEFCERPWDVGRLGSYSLRGPHYGNYTSFRKAILTEFSQDVDFLMIMESDCKLTIPIEEFVNKVYESCDYINKYGIYYMSFGDDKNLRTGEMVSDIISKFPEVEWMYETNKIIGIQCIMFPKFARDYVQKSYETCLWDVSDLYFNNVFKYKKKGIAPCLTNQIEGISTIQGENITHFLLKNEKNLLNDKNPNDILVEFNKDDQNFHFVLSDFYPNEINDIKIVVKSKDNDNIYSVTTTLSPHNSIWIKIYEYDKYYYFDFDFYYEGKKQINSSSGNFLFSKHIKMKDEEIREIEKTEIKNVEYQEIIIEEKYICTENEFDVSFDENENKIWIKYTGKKTKLDVNVTDIDSNFPIHSLVDTIFENSYSRWIMTERNIYKIYSQFNGFNLFFIDSDTKKILFKKSIKLRNNKPLCNINFYSDIPYVEYDNYYHVFFDNDFQKLNITNKDKWIIDLGSGTGTFIGYAYQMGAQNIIGIESNEICSKISSKTFSDYKNVKLLNKAIYKNSNENVTLFSYFGNESDNLTFNGSIVDYSNSNKKTNVSTISLIDLMKTYNIDKIDVLKCDIEGYEWELFDNLSDDIFEKINRIHLDFHNNFNGESRKIIDRFSKLGFKYTTENSIDSSMATVLFFKNNTENIISINKEDELFVILTYPNTTIKENITKKCIENLKNDGRKILLASHYPVSNELQSMVDYYLFDKYNPLIEHTLYKYYWSDMGNVKVDLNLDKLPNYNNLNQSLTVLNNLENSIRFANQIGYKRIINISYDFILNQDNINTINNICNRINNEGTHGYFMKYGESDMSLLKSVFFVVDTDFYINNFENIRTPEKYNNECTKIGAHNFLENYYMNKLKNVQHLLTIDETDEDKLFNNENINIFSGVEYLNIIPVKNQPDSFVIWFNSSNKNDDRRINFKFIKNGNVETTTIHTVKSKSYYYKKFNLENDDSYNIIVDFLDFEGKKINCTYSFYINKNNINEISENGLFTEK